MHYSFHKGWGKRPLSPEHIKYACGDVLDLKHIWESQCAEAKKLGQTAFVANVAKRTAAMASPPTPRKLRASYALPPLTAASLALESVTLDKADRADRTGKPRKSRDWLNIPAPLPKKLPKLPIPRLPRVLPARPGAAKASGTRATAIAQANDALRAQLACDNGKCAVTGKPHLPLLSATDAASQPL